MKFQLHLTQKKEKEEKSDFAFLLKDVFMARCKECGNEFYGLRSKGQAIVCATGHESRRIIDQQRWVDKMMQKSIDKKIQANLRFSETLYARPNFKSI